MAVQGGREPQAGSWEPLKAKVNGDKALGDAFALSGCLRGLAGAVAVGAGYIVCVCLCVRLFVCVCVCVTELEGPWRVCVGWWWGLGVGRLTIKLVKFAVRVYDVICHLILSVVLVRLVPHCNSTPHYMLLVRVFFKGFSSHC